MVKKKVSNKGMNKNLIIGIIVVALLLVGGFLYFSGDDELGLSPSPGEIQVVSMISGGEFASKKINDLCNEKKVALYAPRIRVSENTAIEGFKVRIMPADRSRAVMEKLVSDVEVTFYDGNQRVGNRHFVGTPDSKAEIEIKTPGIELRPGIKYSVKMYANLNEKALSEHRGWEKVTLHLLNVNGWEMSGNESVYWGGNSKYHTGKFTRVDNTGCSSQNNS